MNIDIAVEGGQWPDEDRLFALVTSALAESVKQVDEDISSDNEVSFLFTDNDQVRALNKQWRGQDKPTNVLSFSARESGGPPTPVLGDIVLAFETVEREASEQNKPLDHHLTHLVVHGFLHLLGHDHIDDGEAVTMEAKERNILANLGIADPYSDA